MAIHLSFHLISFISGIVGIKIKSEKHQSMEIYFNKFVRFYIRDRMNAPMAIKEPMAVGIPRVSAADDVFVGDGAPELAADNVAVNASLAADGDKESEEFPTTALPVQFVVTS